MNAKQTREYVKHLEISDVSFLEGWDIEVKKVLIHGVYREVRGEKESVYMLLESDVYRKEAHTAEYRDLKMGLSLGARNMWDWLLFELGSNSVLVWLNRANYMKYTQVSDRAVNDALRELVKVEMIFRVKCDVKDVYGLNPRYAFVGSRKDTFPANVVVKERKGS